MQSGVRPAARAASSYAWVETRLRVQLLAVWACGVSGSVLVIWASLGGSDLVVSPDAVLVLPVRAASRIHSIQGAAWRAVGRARRQWWW